jgi:insulysin
VDSEYKSGHQSDNRRIFQLDKYLSQPGHVWSKFGAGNRESLLKAAKELKAQGKLNETIQNDSLDHLNFDPSPVASRIPSSAPFVTSNGSELDADGGSVGRETRRRLVEWWTKEYCASRMRLCVIGKGRYHFSPIRFVC